MAAVIDLTTPARVERRAGTRRAALLGLVVLVVLNVVDVVLTSRFLDAGVPEGNPVMVPLVEQSWMAMSAKLTVLGLLGYRLVTRQVPIGVLCGVWAVAGVYAAVAMVNWMILQQVS